MRCKSLQKKKSIEKHNFEKMDLRANVSVYESGYSSAFSLLMLDLFTPFMRYIILINKYMHFYQRAATTLVQAAEQSM